MDAAEFKKRLAQCKAGAPHLRSDGLESYGGARITDAEANMNICLLLDEDLSIAQKRAMYKLTSYGLDFSQEYRTPNDNKYHGAIFCLEREAERIKESLARAKRAAKDEAAGLNHLVEERKRKLKNELEGKKAELDKLEARSSKRARK